MILPTFIPLLSYGRYKVPLGGIKLILPTFIFIFIWLSSSWWDHIDATNIYIAIVLSYLFIHPGGIKLILPIVLFVILVKLGQVRPGQIRQLQVKSGHIRSGQVRSCQVSSGLIRSGQVRMSSQGFGSRPLVMFCILLYLMKFQD